MKFTAQEIKEAVFSMSAIKVPRPDGYPTGFYQKYWDTIGSGVTKYVLEVIKEEKDIRNINHTYLFLIPKQARPENPNQFRPISPCNVLYKIVAKVIVNHLKKVMDNIISPNQAAFISGQLFSNNILIVHEMLYHLKSNAN